MPEMATTLRPTHWRQLGGALLVLVLSAPAALARLSGAYAIEVGL